MCSLSTLGLAQLSDMQTTKSRIGLSATGSMVADAVIGRRVSFDLGMQLAATWDPQAKGSSRTGPGTSSSQLP
jgi:hypothetical protein